VENTKNSGFLSRNFFLSVGVTIFKICLIKIIESCMEEKEDQGDGTLAVVATVLLLAVVAVVIAVGVLGALVQVIQSVVVE
jgi:hypothetical protein